MFIHSAIFVSSFEVHKVEKCALFIKTWMGRIKKKLFDKPVENRKRVEIKTKKWSIFQKIYVSMNRWKFRRRRVDTEPEPFCGHSGFFSGAIISEWLHFERSKYWGVLGIIDRPGSSATVSIKKDIILESRNDMRLLSGHLHQIFEDDDTSEHTFC